jgi:polar amino acid transport system permease protein
VDFLMLWDWQYARQVLGDLFPAFALTIEITLVSTAFALVGGLCLALLRRSRVRWLSLPAAAIIEFVRNTPLLVQLYFFYFVPPTLGLTVSPLATGIFALSLHYSTYNADVYRAGIENVPSGQWDAAHSLDFSTYRMWRSVILPQAIPPIVPALGNYVILMLKDTPLLSAITVVEVLAKAEIIADQTFRYTEPLTIVGILFLVVSYISSVLLRVWERHVGYAR